MYKKERKWLFTCFIDFKSAFDFISRPFLFFKLFKLGMSSKFLTILRDIYGDVESSMKIAGRLSCPFSSNIGVKQGCVLSPALFNLFVSDLPSIFDSTCEPPSLYDTKVNCLMYADDLVVLSESAAGLQTALNKLSVYCEKWGLTGINVKKLKS